MNKSETIGELAKALVQVQAKIEGAKMDSENPFFKSKYADLSSIWEACRKPLTANGLAVVQTADTDDSRVIIETTLLHTSGEWISGRLAITPMKPDPQGVGSAITYARRYCLAAIVGICPEDDDAEGAMARGQKVKEEVKPKPVAKQQDNEPNWSQFWVEVGKLGLDSAAAHDQLGVKSIKDELVAKGTTLQQVLQMLVEKVGAQQKL